MIVDNFKPFYVPSEQAGLASQGIVGHDVLHSVHYVLSRELTPVTVEANPFPKIEAEGLAVRLNAPIGGQLRDVFTCHSVHSN